MDLNNYQRQARNTALYPDLGSNPIYPALGLCGEAGEVADKVKKVLRDEAGVFSDERRQAIALELGDVLWYVSQLADELGFSLETVAQANLDKLASRAQRQVIGAVEISDETRLFDGPCGACPVVSAAALGR